MEWSNLLRIAVLLSPILLVHLAAFILGLVNLNRHKSAALLAMLGGMLAGLSLLGATVVRELIWQNARQQGEGVEKAATLATIISIVGNVIDAIGMGMIVVAVFVGRKKAVREEREDRDDDRRDPQSDSREPE